MAHKLKTKSVKLETKTINLKFLIFCFSFALFALHFTFLAFAQNQSKEEETFFVAKKAFEDGFYEVSLGLFGRFLKDYPDSEGVSEAHLLIGESFFYQGRYSEALNKFQSLLNQPKASNFKDAVYYWIAEVNFKSNNFLKAAEYYRKVLDEFPNSSYIPSACYSLGWCLFQEQKFQEAYNYFKQVLDKYPKEPQAQDSIFKIIECLYNLKSYPLLKVSINERINKYSNDQSQTAFLYFYLAEAEYYSDNLNEAVAAYTKAIANTQDSRIQALSKLGLGWTYIRLKQYNQAQDTFFGLNSSNLEKKSQELLFLAKAFLALETNRVNEAINIYDNLLKETSDPVVLVQSYIGKAGALYNLADYENASLIYYQALSKLNIKVIPKDVLDSLYSGLCWTLLKKQDLNTALTEFKKIDFPSDDITYFLGLAFFNKQDYEGCKEVLLRFEEDFLNSNLRLRALYLLGMAEYNLKDLKMALEIFRIIVRNYRDNSEILQKSEYALADCLYLLGEEDEAILRFKSLRSKYPESRIAAEAMFRLGEYYLKQDDLNLAARYFSSLIQDFPGSDLLIYARQALANIDLKVADNLEEQGKIQEALDEYIKITKSNNQDKAVAVKALLRIAQIYEEKGDLALAAENYKKIITLNVEESKFARERLRWIKTKGVVVAGDI